MTSWDTEDELTSAAAASLPTPTDTPYRTPSRSSRISRRSATPPELSSSPPPPLPDDKADRPPPVPFPVPTAAAAGAGPAGGSGSKRQSSSSKDLLLQRQDEKISILDPRRFTPTLHANLVSEILALRRDQEDKLKTIEALEGSLASAREEHESAREGASREGRENRSLKRQLALLEGGTSSALGELARERDEAEAGAAEARKRLEAAQRRAKAQEDDSRRVHDLWARDKDGWQEDRRRMERKLHVAETRLKAVLDEVAGLELEQQAGATAMIDDGGEGHESESNNHQQQEEETEGGAPPRRRGRASSGSQHDAASVRSMSVANSIRRSIHAEGGFGGGGGKALGHSLADELDLGDEDDDDDDDVFSDAHTDADGRQSVASSHRRHTRAQSRDSVFSSPSRTHAHANAHANAHHRRQQSSGGSHHHQMRPGSRSKLFMNQSVFDRLSSGIREADEDQLLLAGAADAKPKPEYVDTGVQPSPPPSPRLLPATTVAAPSPSPSPFPRSFLEAGSKVERAVNEIEAINRRKRQQINKTTSTDFPPLAGPAVPTASAACQTTITMDEPPSPPKTPVPDAAVPAVVVETKSMATQTEDVVAAGAAAAASSPSSPIIPSISVIPPTSRPTSPHEQRLLPQHAKDFGCQVAIPLAVEMTENGMQTDEIRIDQRLDRLPPHLHPSAISSRPTSPNVGGPLRDNDDGLDAPPPRNPRRLTTGKRGFTSKGLPSSPPDSPDMDHHDDADAAAYGAYDDDDENDDDDPQTPTTAAKSRLESFLEFEAASSDDDGDEPGDDLSDPEYQTALSARPKSSGRRSKRFSASAMNASPEHPRGRGQRQPQSMMSRIGGGTEIYSTYSLVDKAEQNAAANGGSSNNRNNKSNKASGGGSRADKSITMNPNSRAGVMRKAAMIQSGIASHQQQGPGRPRSPSLPDAVRDPPFPIPARASSKKPPFFSAEPGDYLYRDRADKRNESWHRRGIRTGPYRHSSIRKSRSVAAMPRHSSRRSSRSPPPPRPMSPSEEAPESPSLPPLPSNDLTGLRGSAARDDATSRSSRGRSGRSGHRKRQSTNTAYTDNTAQGSTNSSGRGGYTQQQQQQGGGGGSSSSTVVDAIAQTMVGEWMFKYVRRRKSFGVDNNSAINENSNDRHKRWVWLAPYERSILWSSKQPSSGSALMGKSGRKLNIQSVLDVKDDNPAPKGITQIFNRSILILTPQRALKFTATSAERHYLWLTSLSFLAHSQQAVPEIFPPSMAVRPPSSKVNAAAAAAAANSSTAASAAASSSTAAPTSAVDADPLPLRRKPGIRDSIMLKKGKSSAGPASLRTLADGGSSLYHGRQSGVGAAVGSHANDDAFSFQSEAFPSMPSHSREMSREAAEPPFIPRFHDRVSGIGAAAPDRGGGGVHERANQVVLHGRKRSNTGGHTAPPLSFRGFSGPPSSYHAPSSSTAGNSIGTAGSSDIYYSNSYNGGQSQPSSAGWAPSSGWPGSTAASAAAASQRTSEASSRPAAGGNNFFEAIGTVRMEAFISPLGYPQFHDHPDETEEWQCRARRRSKEIRRHRSRSRHRDSYASRGTRATAATADSYPYSGSGRGVGAAGDEDYFRDDPFKGF